MKEHTNNASKSVIFILITVNLLLSSLLCLCEKTREMYYVLAMVFLNMYITCIKKMESVLLFIGVTNFKNSSGQDLHFVKF